MCYRKSLTICSASYAMIIHVANINRTVWADADSVGAIQLCFRRLTAVPSPHDPSVQCIQFRKAWMPKKYRISTLTRTTAPRSYGGEFSLQFSIGRKESTHVCHRSSQLDVVLGGNGAPANSNRRRSATVDFYFAFIRRFG